jgi:glutathione S-transferase
VSGGKPAIILYHCASARSFRPLWTLEEMGLAYELRMLPFPPRALAPHYLAVNPLGTVPLLIDGATRMTESAAICQYLATRHGPTPLAIGPDEADFGAWLNWLHFGEATLTFPQTLVLRYGMLEPPERRLPQAAEDYTRWFLGRLRGIEAALADREFLCGDRFTVADISVGYALMLGRYTGLDKSFPERAAAYWQRLRKRDGFQRALAAQDKAGREQGVPAGA